MFLNAFVNDDAAKSIIKSRAEPSRAEPSRAEPSRAEPSRAEPSRAEPSRAEPSRAEPSRAEPSRAEPSRAEPSRAEPSLGYCPSSGWPPSYFPSAPRGALPSPFRPTREAPRRRRGVARPPPGTPCPFADRLLGNPRGNPAAGVRADTRPGNLDTSDDGDPAAVAGNDLARPFTAGTNANGYELTVIEVRFGTILGTLQTPGPNATLVAEGLSPSSTVVANPTHPSTCSGSRHEPQRDSVNGRHSYA